MLNNLKLSHILIITKEVEPVRERALLDDDTGLRKIDVSGMVDMIAGLPEDMSKVLTGDTPKVPAIKGLKNIVLSGMGGSAIGGDILRHWSGPKTDVPIIVNRGYRIPGFVDEGTLFISLSFSGNTEETLSAFEESVAKGCNVVALSTGGKLETMAKEKGVPHVKITAPDGMVPRAALGLMLVPLALILEGAGLVQVRDDLKEAIDVISALKASIGHDIPWEDNECKRIATTINGTIPVINGHSILEVAALRWKTQLNENSKMMAWADELPEMDHNSIVGWSNDKAANEHSAVILRDRISEEADARLRNRIEATKDEAWNKAGKVVEVRSEGEGALARILSTIYKGDYASLYLAILRKVDPTPVKAIEDLKRKLKDMGS